MVEVGLAVTRLDGPGMEPDHIAAVAFTRKRHARGGLQAAGVPAASSTTRPLVASLRFARSKVAAANSASGPDHLGRLRLLTDAS